VSVATPSIWTSVKELPKEGRAIVWIAPNGSEIQGCLSYRRIKRAWGDDLLTPQWLPLLDYDRLNKADVAIKYLPIKWKYRTYDTTVHAYSGTDS
jgi:hypothetical protein